MNRVPLFWHLLSIITQFYNSFVSHNKKDSDFQDLPILWRLDAAIWPWGRVSSESRCKVFKWSGSLLWLSLSCLINSSSSLQKLFDSNTSCTRFRLSISDKSSCKALLKQQQHWHCLAVNSQRDGNTLMYSRQQAIYKWAQKQAYFKDFIKFKFY